MSIRVSFAKLQALGLPRLLRNLVIRRGIATREPYADRGPIRGRAPFGLWAGVVPLFVLCCALCNLSVAADLAREKPNVVVILADDLGWGETGCYGQTKIRTPNIDRLAAQGMRFTRHYSGAPVCAPSRCVLMTGKHLGHAEIRGNRQAKIHFPQFAEGQYPLSERSLTLAQVFQRSGYTTGAIGKWGLGPVGSSGDPNRKGFELFFGYNCQSIAHSYYPPHLWRNDKRIVINAKPVPGHRKQPQGGVRLDDWIGEIYAPKLMIDEAVKFIETNRSRPFFLYLPFIEPHVAMHPPRQSVTRFPAEWDTEAYRGQCGYLPHPRPRAAYAAMITDLDSYVGRIMETLDKIGLADRTLVIFSSDNGTTHPHPADKRYHVGGVDAAFFNSTAGLRGFKGSLYEGGIRVPLIVRWPGRVKTGAVSDTPGYFADWFPTLCDAAGLEKPSDLDGESLWPIMTGAKAPMSRKPMIWAFPEYGGQVAVRLGDFKIIRQGLTTRSPGPWEVYDLGRDAAEQHDLADSHTDLIHQAEKILRREVAQNAVFPLVIPGVNNAVEKR
jgi:arylsulfatase A